MATFKVGQKVRIVAASNHKNMIGMEAVITRPLHLCENSHPAFELGKLVYGIDVPGCPHPIFDDWTAPPEALAPLTDPDEWADAQIAKLKKLGPLPVKEIA